MRKAGLIAAVFFWVVTWKIGTWVSEPCPDFKPDKFGRWPATMCAVAHGRIEQSEMSRRFDDEQEAKAFAKEAEEANGQTGPEFAWRQGQISDVRIEEVHE